MSTQEDPADDRAIPCQPAANAPGPSVAPGGPANQGNSEGGPVVAAKRKPDDNAVETEPAKKKEKQENDRDKNQSKESTKVTIVDTTTAVEELIHYKNIYEELIKRIPSIIKKEPLNRLVHEYSKDKLWFTEDIALSQLKQRASYKYNISRLETLLLDIWISDFDLEKGIQYNLMPIIEHQLKIIGYSDAEKQTALIIRDIPLSPQWEIDDKTEQIYRGNRCQYVVARGLKGKWTQLVYYNYDERMDGQVIMKLINELYRISLPVVTISCEVDSDWSLELLTNVGITRGLEAPS